MNFAKVIGTVVASQKVSELKGHALKVLLPCNAEGVKVGEPVVAIDAIGARSGDLVMWVGKREASLALEGATLVNQLPVDAAITGIIDDVDVMDEVRV